MLQTTCCVTGHREIAADRVEWVKAKLREEVEQAVREGFTIFLSGFAQGADLYFAEAVMEQKVRHPQLILKAAIPYRGRLGSQDPLFCRCLAACDSVYVQQEAYSPGCFAARNRALVEQAGRVIAVYDGRRQGGTFFTLRYARRLGRQVRQISIEAPCCFHEV